MQNDNNITLLEQQMANNEDICCSCGNITSFPQAFFDRFHVTDVGIIVCTSGSFSFTCEGVEYQVATGETAFLSHGVSFTVTRHSADCSVVIILYRVDSIRDILGNTVVGMKFMEFVNPKACRVMHTGHEDELTHYSQLLAAGNGDANVFALNERRLLLLSLTYRLCSIFRALSADGDNEPSRKLETYMRLMQLIDSHYAEERGVRYHARQVGVGQHRAAARVQGYYQEGGFADNHHRQEHQGNRRHPQLPQCFSLRYFLQEAGGHVARQLSAEGRLIYRQNENLVSRLSSPLSVPRQSLQK